eukprot:COSAG01_NODE_3923_length_5530_cov_16.244338_6_plen_129_part_00
MRGSSSCGRWVELGWAGLGNQATEGEDDEVDAAWEEQAAATELEDGAEGETALGGRVAHAAGARAVVWLGQALGSAATAASNAAATDETAAAVAQEQLCAVVTPLPSPLLPTRPRLGVQCPPRRSDAA